MIKKIFVVFVSVVLFYSCQSSSEKNISTLKENTLAKLKAEVPEAESFTDLVIKIDTLNSKALNELQAIEYQNAKLSWETEADNAVSQNAYTNATERTWYFDSLLSVSNHPKKSEKDVTTIKGYMVSAVMIYTNRTKEKSSIGGILFFDNDLLIVPKKTFLLPAFKAPNTPERNATFKMEALSEDELKSAKTSRGSYYFDLRKES